jgi:hypothetical protein
MGIINSCLSTEINNFFDIRASFVSLPMMMLSFSVDIIVVFNLFNKFELIQKILTLFFMSL